MKHKILTIFLILAGICIIAYIPVSNYLNERNSTRAVDNYDKDSSLLDEKEVEELKEAARIYNENLIGQPAHDPFIPGSGVVMPDNYYDMLNVNGTMGTVEIPKIDVKLPIYHGTSSKVLNTAVGHLEGSTLPIGGDTTHAVITGHTGLSHAKIFTDLIELEEGDKFYLKVLGETLAYEVDQIKVIEPSRTDDLKTEKGKDLVTLLTCTPYGVNSHRLLVRGHRVPYNAKEKKAIEKRTGLTKEQIALLIAALITTLIMLVLILMTIWWNRRKNRLAQRKNGE